MKKALRTGLAVLLLFVLILSVLTGIRYRRMSENVQVLETAVDLDTVDADDVYIVYTNDIHSYINNTAKDESEPALRLSNIAALAEDLEDLGHPTLLVDAGDAIQGTTYGSMDKGRTVISLMNAAGYDFAVPGNHDFDYGAEYFVEMVKEEADFPYICCDFFNYPEHTLVFPAYRIYEINGLKVGFVGITTPEARITSTPTHFCDENGNFKYTFSGLDNLTGFYANIQLAIDFLKPRCDYIIGVGHLGIGMESQKLGYSSPDVIANTSGLDVLIDGHSHSVVEGEMIKDSCGRDVLLTQTGCDLEYVGVLTLSKEKAPVSTLLSTYPNSDERVAMLEDSVYEAINAQMGIDVATLGTTLYINDPENPDRRLIRSQEMNSGDFVADAFYWYFNDQLDLGCDIVLHNAGGVRAQLPQGTITYMDVKNLQPFGNQLCVVKTSGQTILDALEAGVTVIGEWDDKRGAPAENGGLMQVSGLTYTVDPSVPSSVVYDGAKNFVRVDKDYRVKDVKVYNRETGEFDPLEPDQFYTVGGVDHVIQQGGDGLTMFKDAELVLSYVSMDFDVVCDYLNSFPVKDGLPFISSEGSPLAHRKGFPIDYENPAGAGRMIILD